MKNFRIASMIATVAVLLVFAGKSSASDDWDQVTSPNIGASDNVLASVAVNAANDIWAVGQYAPDSNPNMTLTLVNHFDGQSWLVVPSPNVGANSNALYSVAVKSGTAWAVGYYLDDSFTTRSLIETWDGARWEIVDHPHTGASDLLFAVTAVSTSDVWAVGSKTDSSGGFQTVIEHFDGTTWSIVPSPNPGAIGNQLFAVKAISADSVWATGERTGTHEPDSALIEHWDGTSWSVVNTPTDAASSTVLYGVSGVTDDDVRT